MTKWTVIAIIVMATMTGCKQAKLDARLRTDGIYQSDSPTSNHDEHGPSWHYLRFYDDCVVISASSTGTPEKIKTWFNKNRKNKSDGVVNTEGGKITFTIRSIVGEVDYSGTTAGDTLELTSVSRIPGYEGITHVRNYMFIKT